jgi:hypothetical protein
MYAPPVLRMRASHWDLRRPDKRAAHTATSLIGEMGIYFGGALEVRCGRRPTMRRWLPRVWQVLMKCKED